MATVRARRGSVEGDGSGASWTSVPIDRAGHGVAAFEHAAVDGAVSQRDDNLRIRRGLVHVLQGPLHVHGHRAGDHQCVGMARRCGNVNAEPFGVVYGIHERVHLHLTGVAGARIHFTDGQ